MLDARLEDAAFTFDRDVAVGIDELAGRLDRITFIEGGGTFADKAAKLVELVGQLGGDEHAREAAKLAKADQASELVREFAELEGVIGAEYARLAGRPDDVCIAIAEHYLPDAADAPLPSTSAGCVLSAADRIDTLTVSFSLGHRPTGSRDPYGLRRAAIGLCRLAVEGGVAISHELLAPDVREFVEERLEGYLDVPVEFVRAARRGQPGMSAPLPTSPGFSLSRTSSLSTRRTRAPPASSAAKSTMGGRHGMLVEPAERSLAESGAWPAGAGRRPRGRLPVGRRPRAGGRTVLRRCARDGPGRSREANRLRLVRDVRDAVGRLGDLSQIPL